MPRGWVLTISAANPSEVLKLLGHENSQPLVPLPVKKVSSDVARFKFGKGAAVNNALAGARVGRHGQTCRWELSLFKSQGGRSGTPTMPCTAARFVPQWFYAVDAQKLRQFTGSGAFSPLMGIQRIASCSHPMLLESKIPLDGITSAPGARP